MIPGYRFYHQYLSPYLSEPEKKDRTVSLLTLATLFFLGTFAIRPTITLIASLSLELEEGRANEKALEEKIETLKKAQENYQAAEGSLYLLEEALPSRRNPALLLEAVSFILGKNNLALEEVDFKESSLSTNPKFLTLPLSVFARGEYPNFTKALSDFEKALHAQDVESVKVTYQEKTRDLEIVLDLKTYYYE